jgi:hypothetical protein
MDGQTPNAAAMRAGCAVPVLSCFLKSPGGTLRPGVNSMVAMTVLALIGGALLGTRFNVWALLVCLGAMMVLTTGTMMLTSCGVTSTMIATCIIVTGAEIGYLAGAYATQAGMLRRALRLASSPINR